MEYHNFTLRLRVTHNFLKYNLKKKKKKMREMTNWSRILEEN